MTEEEARYYIEKEMQKNSNFFLNVATLYGGLYYFLGFGAAIGAILAVAEEQYIVFGILLGTGIALIFTGTLFDKLLKFVSYTIDSLQDIKESLKKNNDN